NIRIKPNKKLLQIQKNSPQAMVIESLLEQPFEMEALDRMVEDIMQQQQVLVRFSDSMNSVFFQNGNVVIQRNGKMNTVPRNVEVGRSRTYRAPHTAEVRNIREMQPAEDIFLKRN